MGRRLLVPNGDDAAAWRFAADQASVITTDTLVEGVHFDLAYTPPRAVGRKLIAVNASDVAAMGARPRYALLALSVSPSMPVATMSAIAEGVREACREQGIAVIGGNTTRTAGPMVLTATVIGRARPERLVRREGARPGDALFVTGTLGDAAAGLTMALAGEVPAADDPLAPLFSALVDPVPRVEAGRRLGRSGCVRAMCDVSDGLGRDLRNLLAPSRLGARLDAEAVPLSPALRAFAASRAMEPLRLALRGGEDYELLFAAAPEDAATIARVCALARTPVTCIGEVTDDPAIAVMGRDGSVMPLPSGFAHF